MENSQETPSNEQSPESPPPPPVMTPMRVRAATEVLAFLGSRVSKVLPSLLYSRQAKEGLAAARVRMKVLDPGTNKEMSVVCMIACLTAEAEAQVEINLSSVPKNPQTAKADGN